MNFRKNMKTYWQWIQVGRMPKDEATFESGEHLNDLYNCRLFGVDYYYCHRDDTYPATVEELNEAYENYN